MLKYILYPPFFNKLEKIVDEWERRDFSESGSLVGMFFIIPCLAYYIAILLGLMELFKYAKDGVMAL